MDLQQRTDDAQAQLLSIAFDASYTHMYAPGTQRHIKAALKVGASMEEIMEVLKLCKVEQQSGSRNRGRTRFGKSDSLVSGRRK
ncbi:MAG: hypothetical protein ACREQN_11425 [Candidatus Binataceae bacterium]